MTAREDGRLTAAILLLEQATRLLKETRAPKATPSHPRPDRSPGEPARLPVVQQLQPRPWRCQLVPLTADEHLVLEALAAGAEADGVYRQGIRALEGAVHIGRGRLQAALDALQVPMTRPDVDRPALVAVRPGPRGRWDISLEVEPAHAEQLDLGPEEG